MSDHNRFEQQYAYQFIFNSWILFTVGDVDWDIGRHSGRYSGRQSVDIAVDSRSIVGRWSVDSRSIVGR